MHRAVFLVLGGVRLLLALCDPGPWRCLRAREGLGCLCETAVSVLFGFVFLPLGGIFFRSWFGRLGVGEMRL